MKVITQSHGVQNAMQDLDFNLMEHAHNALTTHGVMEPFFALHVISLKIVQHAVPQMDSAQDVKQSTNLTKIRMCALHAQTTHTVMMD